MSGRTATAPAAGSTAGHAPSAAAATSRARSGATAARSARRSAAAVASVRAATRAASSACATVAARAGAGSTAASARAGSSGASARSARARAAGAAAAGRSGRVGAATKLPGANGTFILAELGGEAGEQIARLQARYDPKLARESPPHVTLAGSSGVGVVPPDVVRARVLAALAPVGASSPPLVLPFGPPERFPGTNIVVLPLDPHGPMRALHDRIAACGLPFARARFSFTPHATLSFYPTLSPARLRELLAVRIETPAVIDRLLISYTRSPQPAVNWFELPLTGSADGAAHGDGGR